MKYTGNVYEGRDTLILDYSALGLQDMNVANSVPELLEETGLFKLQGVQETTVKLPTTMRFGASMELGKFAHVGVDLVAPFDRNSSRFS